MEEETEYTKLPLEDRCVHKSWKARLHGYEECSKKFQCIDDEKSPEWNKFLGLVKKFVVDSNAAAQEKGLEAALAFIENAACAGKTVGEVMSGIVSKCIAAPKMKTKELAVQITLMFVEIEKHEAVQEELMKGTEAKNPKIVSACIATLTLALKEFGPKVMNVKPLMKKIPGFLEDRDKGVRDEGKVMVVEIYRWIGVPLKQQLNSLKPVTMSELEIEFGKLTDSKAVPSRYLRSQKPKVMSIDPGSGVGGGDGASNEDDDDQESAAVDIDPYELIDPVDILSKLPKDFYDKVEAKKWQERKEALEALETLTKNPKLESGEYGDVVRVLKKIISKDSNVVVVTLAVKCLTGLATGLKKRFQTYAGACLPAVLEKFREKKPNVVATLREAADAIFLTINIESMMEDALAALDNKNPAVKAETAAFLSRSFARTPPASLNKKLLKAYSAALLKTLNEPDPTVRDNSAEALGTAMKLVGEKAMLPFVTDIDPLKMAKIKECSEKAVIHVKISGPPRKTERPSTAPAKMANEGKAKESSETTSKTTAKRPNTTATKRSATMKKSTTSSTTNLAGSAASKKSSSKTQPEKNLSSEEVDELASQMLSPEIISGLTDSNWKTRLSASEQLSEAISQMESSEVNCQVIVRTLGKKPGFKDTNFQVAKLRLEIVKMLAENYTFSPTTSEYCIMDVTEKLGDAKNSSIASETLTAIAEATSFEMVANEAAAFAFNQKNPKVQQETLRWLGNALLEFGCTLNVKGLMESVKKAISATNPAVRTQAIALLGTLYIFVGRSLLMFFENEKPALRQQIEQECDKRSGETPPAPIRGPKTKSTRPARGNVDYEAEERDEMCDSQPEMNDLLPRVDISSQVTESLLAELADKNWKVRNEALQKISAILSEARLLKGSIGELPRGLAPRLVDSNTRIAQTTLGICETLATAMGPPAKQHIRTLFPGFVQCLGDSKTWIRSAAITCINTWGEECGYKEFFDGEMIATALKSGSPTLRTELWAWLACKLPPIPVKQICKEELLACVPYLYSNLEDRNSDVRKNAQEAVLGFMIHLSYEGMARQTEKLKPGSKSVVLGALDKARPNLPVKPLPSKKIAPPEESAHRVVKGGGKTAKTATKGKAGSANAKPGSARKKADDEGAGNAGSNDNGGPLLVVNNLKHQRLIDEQKLKVIKWNFTTPREEFVDLLKELMGSAGVNKTLIANMFHVDFRYHLKAIESLTEDLQDNSKALVSNLDLILKWLTLRFFDTNPSVVHKGLEYLQTVFTRLIEDEYHMLENEAASFIPYLVTKIGDPKDTVRMGVRALFRQIALVYPVSKLFSYVMEGLKSKNARQRTECLDQLGSLIENYGISVCQPSPTAALREVAKQIADRDNSVRNAALNCIVQAYFLEGERIIKLVGQISEKDLSLLEERIKRAAKNRPVKSASSARISVPVAAVSATVAADDGDADYDEENEDDEPVEEPEDLVPEDRDNNLKKDSATKEDKKVDEPITILVTEAKKEEDTPIQVDDNGNHDIKKTHPSPTTRAKTSGPFGLDMDFLKKLEESAPVRWKVPNLVDPAWDPNESISALKSPTSVVPSLTPPKLVVSRTGLLSPVTTPPTKEDRLERTILSMASLDLPIAIQSMNAIETLLQSDQVTMMQSKEDKFISSVTMQLKLLQTYPLRLDSDEVIKGFRTTFVTTLAFYNTGILGKNVPPLILQELVHQMITLLAENKLKPLDHPDAYTRVINNIVVKVIDHSNHSTVICVMIKILHGCAVSNGPPKYEELVMKCLWKIVKAISGWAGDLDYDSILLEVHHFLKDYPTAWWKKRSSDMPLRTIKTLLHSMTKVKGSTILSHMTKINNTEESELQSYLDRLIATFRPDEISSGTRTITKSSSQGRAPKRLSKFTHEQLSEIFKKIGSKHQVQEGLAQLYDFKLQHPEADVQPFLVKSHQFFQDFIEQGLKDIDQARKSQNINAQCNNQYTTDNIPSETPSITAEKGAMDPIQRLEKLRALEAQYRAISPNQSNRA
ncbi:protein mini spindles isoform X2 [Venturia canescens]|uniref:protein mini spindles isoform X2 n=1 Tax=Venturia canescens TaxID=32260 RepID=UPI001C9C4CF0|nr:protein mini spindles isoform X2 [Venturia canescens]